MNSREQASLSKHGDSRFPRSVRSATTFVTASGRWTLGISLLSPSVDTALFSPFSPECNDLRHYIQKVKIGDQSSLFKYGDSRFSGSVWIAATFVTVSRRWTLGSRRLYRSMVTAIFPVQSGVQRPSSLHQEGELSRSGVSLEAMWLPFFPVSPECNDLHHCILKVNSRSQSSLSKRGDSRFSRSVRSATTYVTASRRWTLGIRRLSRSVVTAVFPVQSGVQRPTSLHPEGELSGSGVSIEAWWQPFSPFSPEYNDLRQCIQKVNSRDQASPEGELSGSSVSLEAWCQPFFPFSTECNDLRQCIQKVNSRDQASLSKRCDCRFPRSVRSATTYVTASRRWTLGIRRLSRSDVTAVFPVQSGVQRPSSMHPEGELLGSGVSRRWTLKIRRLSRIVVTAVFPVQSGVQRPSSMHPEGEL